MQRLAAFLVLLLTALAALAGEDPILQTYKKRFSKDAYLSEKEEVAKSLAAAGGLPAREALVWCGRQAQSFVDAAEKEFEKEFARYKPLEAEYMEQYKAWANQYESRGQPVPKMGPKFPAEEKFLAQKANVDSADRKVEDSRAALVSVMTAHGKVLDALATADTEKVKAEIAAGPLAAKDWGTRAELYFQLAKARAPWVLTLLQDAARKEEDPRALAAALEALAGRDPVQVMPTFVARLDDARWAVRAAAIAAIEATPSKEGIEALIARFPKEEGRLRDDCVRALIALTAGECPSTPEAWKQWWAVNGAAWKGAPPKVDKSKQTAEEYAKEVEKQKKRDEGRTGFFGIDVKSRRIVYVIDLSGSMNEKMSKDAAAGDTRDAAQKPEEKTRAEFAKAELGRAVRALDDSALFSIVLYSDNVRMWKTEMVQATPENKKAAQDFVEKSPVIGGTATFDAVEAAMHLGDVGKGKNKDVDPSGDAKLDTIILLSDGKPTLGRVTNPDRIRAEIKLLNQTRKIAIHTVSFGKDADASFMAGLAEDNGGTAVKQ